MKGGGGGQFDPPQEKLLSKSSALLGLRINLSDLWCILVIYFHFFKHPHGVFFLLFESVF